MQSLPAFVDTAFLFFFFEFFFSFFFVFVFVFSVLDHTKINKARTTLAGRRSNFQGTQRCSVGRPKPTYSIVRLSEVLAVKEGIAPTSALRHTTNAKSN